MAPDKDNGFIVATARHGFATLEVDSEFRVTKYMRDPLRNEDLDRTGGGEHPKEERFNDGKCSPEGRFFAGTMDQRW